MEDDAENNEMKLPDIPEFSKNELMTMEKDMTGLYLNGHPMDQYSELVKRQCAVRIGQIMVAFAPETEISNFKDGQRVKIAGVITNYKTKTTKSNTTMAYITLEDDTGVIEMLAFERTLNESGSYIRVNNAVIVEGRISVRDEKEPQLMCDSVVPIDSAEPVALQNATNKTEAKRLYVRIPSENDPRYEYVRKIMIMFPGDEQIILFFEDTRKRVGTNCVIHYALIKELRELFGEENVVIK